MKEVKKDNTVYIISLIVVFAIVGWGFAAPANFGSAANALFNSLVDNFSWLYLISMFVFVAFCVAIGFSKYGKIKLGPDDSVPEFSTVSWFGMLFGSGMGIGLVFWGVAEPLNHFLNPVGIEGATTEAANFAIKQSFFHWGIHPWANYAVIGLALAYFQFRKNAPGLISSIFLPLIGEKGVRGPVGKAIDILAIFATVAGVATSLGIGTLQINSGLSYMFGLPTTTMVQLSIIAVITIIYIWTAVSGIDKGIKLLSDLNLILAFAILALSIIVGPKLAMINSLTNGIGMYLDKFVYDSFHIEAFGDNSWIGGWTIFYWAWWIAWAPFVGTFIARISKGRTIKEFVIGVILAPTLASFIWFAVFGSLGINLGAEVAAEATKLTETAFFVVMSKYPLGFIISIIAVFLLGTFFITSANSATFVLGMMSQQGDLNPSNSKKVLWGLVQALLAFALLLGGGLKALQTASIAAAFPFAIVMIFACVALVKALKQEL
ncbi:glycine betaine uptake BCCT transporter [Lutispora saccharofermentans]|uniref:BCCT family transporter n=1 Tax=Lutispora saccharofermentans TaxID=3024236 RepID=A0ABT1NDH1_9FIRM|nr:BCCT family transporter [Lutispora saccharofermentans]MCQ1529302.1 BCCT family transporter [Lutispora saccharofermentans]